MTTVTMLQLRQQAKEILDRCGRGEHIVLTYRGKPACQLAPLSEEEGERTDGIPDSDPFFKWVGTGIDTEPLTNEQIDEVIYGVDAHLRR